MGLNSSVNEAIINRLLNNINIKNNKNLFMLLLNGIKDNHDLCLLLNSDILEQSIILVDYIENNYDKAQVINSILNIMCDIEYDYVKNRKYIYILLERYLEVVNNNYSIFENIKDTIFLFCQLGIENDYIVDEFVKQCDQEICVEIFSKTGINLSKCVSNKYPQLCLLVDKRKRLRTRFDLILHFYLMTNMKYYEIVNVAGDYLKKYGNYALTCADWSFSSKAFDHNYVLNNIISSEEEEVFITIGDMFHRCLDEIMPSDTEELLDYLKSASNKFFLLLKTKEVKDLLTKFTKGRSFFDIAFELPAKEC